MTSSIQHLGTSIISEYGALTRLMSVIGIAAEFSDEETNAYYTDAGTDLVTFGKNSVCSG